MNHTYSIETELFRTCRRIFTAGEYRVLFYLMEYKMDEPIYSISDLSEIIAEEFGCSKFSIRNCFTKLIESGVIIKNTSGEGDYVVNDMLLKVI